MQYLVSVTRLRSPAMLLFLRFVMKSRWTFIVIVLLVISTGWLGWIVYHDRVQTPNRDTRLAEFQKHRYQRTGREFNRPIDQTIEEFSTERDRAMLEMLGTVLRSKSLTDTHCRRLIKVAEQSPSDAHRRFVWRVLFASQSASAMQYLNKTLTGADTATIVQFIGSIEGYESQQVELVTAIYAARTASLVRDAIVDLAIADDYQSDHQEQAQWLLLRWIAEHSTDPARRIRVLRAAFERPGVNRRGRQLVEDTLRQTTSIELRKAIFEMLVSGYGDEFLMPLIDKDEAEQVKTAGLNAYARKVRTDPSVSLLNEGMLLIRAYNS